MNNKNNNSTTNVCDNNNKNNIKYYESDGKLEIEKYDISKI